MAFLTNEFPDNELLRVIIVFPFVNFFSVAFLILDVSSSFIEFFRSCEIFSYSTLHRNVVHCNGKLEMVIFVVFINGKLQMEKYIVFFNAKLQMV